MISKPGEQFIADHFITDLASGVDHIFFFGKGGEKWKFRWHFLNLFVIPTATVLTCSYSSTPLSQCCEKLSMRLQLESHRNGASNLLSHQPGRNLAFSCFFFFFLNKGNHPKKLFAFSVLLSKLLTKMTLEDQAQDRPMKDFTWDIDGTAEREEHFV